VEFDPRAHFQSGKVMSRQAQLLYVHNVVHLIYGLIVLE